MKRIRFLLILLVLASCQMSSAQSSEEESFSLWNEQIVFQSVTRSYDVFDDGIADLRLLFDGDYPREWIVPKLFLQDAQFKSATLVVTRFAVPDFSIPLDEAKPNDGADVPEPSFTYAASLFYQDYTIDAISKSDGLPIGTIVGLIPLSAGSFIVSSSSTSSSESKEYSFAFSLPFGSETRRKASSLSFTISKEATFSLEEGREVLFSLLSRSLEEAILIY